MLQVMLWGTAFFATIYFGFAAITRGLTRLLATAGLGRVLDPSPLRDRQIIHEVGWSCLSILIFGVGALLPWNLLINGWARLEAHASGLRIVCEVLVLLLWNDLHFYVLHRLLHLRALFPRFHIQHHRSRVTTPFSTYAFHPVEALLLGSVPLIPMLAHSFSWQALIALPPLSLFFNCVGHSNYDLFPDRPAQSWLTSSRRHQLHHARFHGNYGFLFAFMDRLCGTELPDDSVATLRFGQPY